MCIYVYIIYMGTCIGGFFPKRAFFTKKCFHGENLWGGVVVHERTYDQIMSGEGGFINAFYNNLNTVNLFPNHVGIFTWRLSPDQNGRIYPWFNS